jgi:hypothetical protein
MVLAMAYPAFQFDGDSIKTLRALGLSGNAIDDLGRICSAYRSSMSRMSAAQKVLPSRSDRTKQMVQVQALAAELHQLLVGDSTLLDMQLAELGQSPADKRKTCDPLRAEDWWSLNQSVERIRNSENRQGGFDPERWGPTLLEGLRFIALGAAEVAAELEASKKKGDTPTPRWRTELIMSITWFAEREGIEVRAGARSSFMQLVEVVYRCGNIPATARSDVSAYLKDQSISRPLKEEKSGL